MPYQTIGVGPGLYGHSSYGQMALPPTNSAYHPAPQQQQEVISYPEPDPIPPPYEEKEEPEEEIVERLGEPKKNVQRTHPVFIYLLFIFAYLTLALWSRSLLFGISQTIYGNGMVPWYHALMIAMIITSLFIIVVYTSGVSFSIFE